MSERLRGQFLVAGRHLKDPHFFHTVVLIVEHNDGGTMGLIVNRLTEAVVREALGGHFEIPEADDLVRYGGPVEPKALFLLHDSVEQSGGELPVLPGLFVGANAEVFENIITTAAATGTRYRVFSGCAGWSPGQLEAELARGDWHTVSADEASVFDCDPYEQWDRLIAETAGRHPLFPDEPGDPRRN